MDGLGQVLDLIAKYGLALVVAGLLAIVVAALWRASQQQWTDRLDYVEKLRDEEHQGRLDAETRLASNSEALREATKVFADSQAFQQQLMERVLDEREARPAGGRRAG